MAEMVRGWFTSAPGLERVNIVGLIVMLAGVLTAVFANRLARLFADENKERMFFAFKLASILICIAGFIIAVI